MAFRILVVEDDPAARKSLSRVIRAKLECEVHEAADPAEARSLLQTYTYTLVLTELSFSKGKLEGLNLIEALAGQALRPGIVATSGYGIAHSLAISRGADAFVSKPAQDGDLLVVLRKVLDKRIHPPAQSPAAAMASNIDALLEQGGSQVFVQPIYWVASEPPALAGVELYTHGPAGTAYERPDVLFAYAREANRECLLDRYCVPRMLQAAAQIPAPMRLAINVHASTLCSSPDFAQFLIEAAAGAEIEPGRITVEIVEHAPAWNQVELLQTLDRMRKHGIRIALDDIGLGRSNFQMMIDAHPDFFKLDRYFIRGCNHDPKRRAAIASIATLATELGAEVIAEGVCSEEELRALQPLGIGLAQGYIFCPPKSLEPGWANLATYDPVSPLPAPDEAEKPSAPEEEALRLGDGAQPECGGGLPAQQPD
jgi:EAL domain-containing protein (putative c-di-GMP-specific phosphodiesterase class I)/ActR/RegA family two-component response regulator